MGVEVGGKGVHDRLIVLLFPQEIAESGEWNRLQVIPAGLYLQVRSSSMVTSRVTYNTTFERPSLGFPL
jgi:hypothetical protein